EGARLALAEAYRNVAVSGARPLGITDCLNFGSPEDPAALWQFTEAIRGLVDGCRELGVPVTGGNVSFYNQTGETAILPTPVVGVLGVIDDVARRTASGFAAEGDAIWLLGDNTEELSGSAWAGVFHHHLGGLPPRVDLDHEARLAEVMIAASTRQLLSSAHDLSDGGLGQAVAESMFRHGFGASITLPDIEPTAALFAETPGRVLVSLPEAAQDAFGVLCGEFGVRAQRLGTVTAAGDGAQLEVADQFTIAVAELREAWQATVPAAMEAAGH